MLVTHLYHLIDTDIEIRLKVLDVLTDTNRMDKSDGSKKELPKNNIFTCNDINELIGILETSTQKYSETDIKQELSKIILKNKEKSKKKKRTATEQGTPIISSYFIEIIQFFPNEPISEQGVVGLFCGMFHILKKIKFEYNNKNITFHSIEYIRTTYPDVRVKTINEMNNKIIYLDIEFELESRNILHTDITKRRTRNVI